MFSRLLNPRAFLCATLFTALGLLFVNYAGLQTDEALFAATIFRGDGGIFSIAIGKHHIPVMFLSYLGALKTWDLGANFQAKIRSASVGPHPSSAAGCLHHPPILAVSRTNS